MSEKRTPRDSTKPKLVFDYGERPCSTTPPVPDFFYLAQADKGGAGEPIANQPVSSTEQPTGPKEPSGPNAGITIPFHPNKPADPKDPSYPSDSEDDGDLFRQTYQACSRYRQKKKAATQIPIPTPARPPIANSPNPSHPGAVIPKPITSLHFSASNWASEPQPRSWRKLERTDWPPTTSSTLLDIELHPPSSWRNNKGKRYTNHTNPKPCVGKYLYQTVKSDGLWCPLNNAGDENLNCGHTLEEWYNNGMDWESRFELRDAGSMGTGVFTRVNWQKDDILGVYLGELVPHAGPNSAYCQQIHIGPSLGNANVDEGEGKKSKSKSKRKSGKGDGGEYMFPKEIAIVDAERYGNWTRFVNHHCDNNANFSELRVGTQRVLALTAWRDIRAGEQIFANYGYEYFEERRCFCGAERCLEKTRGERKKQSSKRNGRGSLERECSPMPSPPVRESAYLTPPASPVPGDTGMQVAYGPLTNAVKRVRDVESSDTPPNQKKQRIVSGFRVSA